MMKTSLIFGKICVKSSKHRCLAFIFSALVLGLSASDAWLSAAAPIRVADAALTTTRGRIAFVSGRDGNREIYTMNSDGSDQRRVTTTSADESDPSWSPDGTRIVFTAKSNQEMDIYVMAADGSGLPQRLTERIGFDRSSNFHPAWSPDGSQIAFVKDLNLPGTGPNVYVVNANGSNPQKLTETGALNDMPAWSPDGKQIVFRSNRLGSRTDIFLMNADGSAETHLPTPPLSIVEHPSFSPDGQQIVFNGTSINNIGGIHLMNADGSNLRRIAGTSVYDSQPAFSPDGSQIAFLAYGGLNGDIYVTNREGGARVRIDGNDAFDGLPDWQRLAVVVGSIDDPENFVRQHYLDFLNRAADAPGLAFWANEIVACGSDAACVERKRVDVSGAFFLSIEFQETGFLAYRLALLSFKEFPRYADFMRDTQEMGRGVVVGQGDWQARLASNQRAFTNEWVMRPAFKAIYDSKTNAEYVDALLSNTFVSFTQSYRDGLVFDLDSGGKTRPEVLRQIAEMPSYGEKETNRAFVLMQYFSYLRRNPDDAPDTNFDGYHFWLSKLNQFNGDFRAAEMVKAFIASQEYRHRFGS